MASRSTCTLTAFSTNCGLVALIILIAWKTSTACSIFTRSSRFEMAMYVPVRPAPSLNTNRELYVYWKTRDWKIVCLALNFWRYNVNQYLHATMTGPSPWLFLEFSTSDVRLTTPSALAGTRWSGHFVWWNILTTKPSDKSCIWN